MKLPNETVELGDQVEDVISGFKGTVLARTVWINGCARITIQPKVGKDGTLPDDKCFDEVQLKIVKRANTPVKETKRRRSNGGPRPAVRQAPKAVR